MQLSFSYIYNTDLKYMKNRYRKNKIHNFILIIVVSPSGIKNLSETDLDVVELLDPVEVDRLLWVAGQVIQLAPVLRASPVRGLGLRQLLISVHQVNILRVPVLLRPHCVAWE